jgi:UDP-2,3-diacylglucosamine pyrophosphatase LpxH
MAVITEGVNAAPLARPYPGTDQSGWRTFAQRGLTEVFGKAKRVPFDNTSRIVFFSDCHRGDGGRLDDFAGNEALFFSALTYYYHEGFTYIEVGDGDELWKNWHFADIRRTYGRVFDLLHAFNQQDRLHLIMGNHDVRGSRHSQMQKDGIAVEEGLILEHAQTGQELFVVHGHQTDIASYYLYRLTRLMVRYIWRRMQLVGFATPMNKEGIIERLGEIERQIAECSRLTRVERRTVAWLRAHRQIVICAHTHRPACAGPGTPYFNTGSCTYPGCITGLELEDGELRLVKWFGRSGGSAHVKRALLAVPKPLHSLN